MNNKKLASLVIGIIIQIIFFYLINTYTKNMKKIENCNCLNFKLLKNFELNNIYNLIFYFVFIFYLYFIYHNFKNPLAIYILIFTLILCIYFKINQIILWRKYIYEKNHKNCDCIITSNYYIINFLIWLDIIYFGFLLLILILIMFFLSTITFLILNQK